MNAATEGANNVSQHHQVVRELQHSLLQEAALGKALAEAIEKAAVPNISSIPGLLNFLDIMVSSLPKHTSRLLGNGLELYFIVSQSRLLSEDKNFQEWMVDFARAMGAFLDTPASAQNLEGFIWDPAYKIHDYAPGPSGWLSFNQFFARQLRPGLRPIAEPQNPRCVVSPCDGMYMGEWRIDDADTITVKDVELSIEVLLSESKHAARFRKGTYSHLYLHATNYHRFHSPVSGRVMEVRKIPGDVKLNVIRNSEHTLEAVPGTGFQFTQDRGITLIDGVHGAVAVIPVGMAQISSVNFSVAEGVNITKGEELGYFQFGGSDIIVLFETPPQMNLLDQQTVKQGERYATYS